MSLEQLANIGELVGGIAVVASLIYLAIQIRQNTNIVKGATLSTNTQNWSNLIANATQPEMAEAHVAGTLGREDIDIKQFTQFFYFCRILFVAFEDQYYQFRHGTMDEEIYLGYERSFQAQILVFPGFQMYWQISKEEFSTEFFERVENLIASNPNDDPSHLIHKWRKLSATYSHRSNVNE